ncbi:hypothetical protein ABZW30_12890 [Kitasatospora sp. NPDC004669]|uniref:hypothetical protein n=1 Tax=Kitasatospora sp. NPDC004669 TaxID=3154555 RepID=UPI0033AC30ED
MTSLRGCHSTAWTIRSTHNIRKTSYCQRLRGRTLLDRLKQANITGLTDALDGVPDSDVAATVSVLCHLIERYVRRVRGSMLSEDDAGFAPPASGRDSVRDAVES